MIRIARIAWKLPSIALAFIALALSLAIVRSPRWQYRIVQQQLKGIAWILGIEIQGKLPPKPPETRFIIANHISYLDIFVIGRLFPTRFLAKAEVSRWPILGLLARLGGTVFVGRDCMLARYRALKTMQRSSPQVCTTIFPEGTTSASHAPSARPWHRGHAFLGRHASNGLYVLGLHYRDQVDVAWIDEQALVPHVLRMLARKRIAVFVEGELIMNLNTPTLSTIPALTLERTKVLALAAADESAQFPKLCLIALKT